MTTIVLQANNTDLTSSTAFTATSATTLFYLGMANDSGGIITMQGIDQGTEPFVTHAHHDTETAIGTQTFVASSGHILEADILTGSQTLVQTMSGTPPGFGANVVCLDNVDQTSVRRSWGQVTNNLTTAAAISYTIGSNGGACFLQVLSNTNEPTTPIGNGTWTQIGTSKALGIMTYAHLYYAVFDGEVVSDTVQADYKTAGGTAGQTGRGIVTLTVLNAAAAPPSPITASVSSTFGPLVSALTGEHKSPPIGSFSANFGALTSDISGSYTSPGADYEGTFAASFGALQADLTGLTVPNIEGAFAASFGAFQSDLTANFNPDPAGSFAATFGALSSNLDGFHLAPGSYPGSITKLGSYNSTGPEEILTGDGGAGLTNMSDNTYAPNLDRYFYINNGSGTIFKFEPDGTYVSTVTKGGNTNTDFEGITHMTGDTFLICNEVNQVAKFDMDDTTTAINIQEGVAGCQLYNGPPRGVSNKGFEGVAYDEANNIVYMAQEDSPMKVLQFTVPADKVDNLAYNYDVDLTFTEPFDAETVLAGVCTDLASIEFNAVTGNLMLLSQESRVIVEVTTAGVIIDTREIGIELTQAEGLAWTPYGDGYSEMNVSGEPSERQYWRGPNVFAEASATFGVLASDITGQVLEPPRGTFAATFGALESSIDANHLINNFGSMGAQFGALECELTAFNQQIPPVIGSVSASFGALTSDLSGTYQQFVSGSLSATFPPLSGDLAGDVSPPVSGSFSTSFGGLTSNLTGSVLINNQGVVDVQFGGLTASLNASLAGAITGTVNAQFGGLTSSLEALWAEGFAGTLVVSFGALEASLVASVDNSPNVPVEYHKVIGAVTFGSEAAIGKVEFLSEAAIGKVAFNSLTPQGKVSFR